MAPAPGGTAPGFFGKVRSHGDFVCRRLPPSFVTPWDRWLQAGLLRSRHDLGDAWLAAWLRAPIWRFQLAAGVCGADGWCGVLMPSLDCVGRYFPLTIAAPLVAGSAGAAWPDCFAAFEALALGALDEDFELSRFDARLGAMAAPPCAAPAAGTSHWSTAGGGDVLANSFVRPGLPPPSSFAALLRSDGFTVLSE